MAHKKRPKNHEVENEMICAVERDGEPPRAATEPAPAHEESSPPETWATETIFAPQRRKMHMATDDNHDPKGGNNGGSRTHSTPDNEVRNPDRASNKERNDEGADPIPDIRKQNPGEKTSADLEDELAPDDPHKVEKLAKAGRDDVDPDAGSD